LYAPSLQFCQAGTNEVKERCGTATYTSTEFCQSSNVVKPLCDTEEYTSAQFCQAGTNAVLPLCGTATYTETEFCQAGTNAVLPLCGTATYTETEFCQAVTNAVLPLCGGTATFTSTEFCQNGTVINKCGGTAEYTTAQFCYSNGKVGNFCGNRTETTYDPDLYECKPSINANGIYLKTGITDSRDNNKHYNAVLIGTQTWMAENLNYGINGSKCGSILTGSGTIGDANTTACDRYGRLYNWSTAMAGSTSSEANPSGRQGVCPAGWHLPSLAEWNVLMKFVNPSCTGNDGCAGVGAKLKATSDWNSNYGNSGNGTDDFGFSALPGGDGIPDGSLIDVGNNGNWWSASESDANNAHFLYMRYNSDYAGLFNFDKNLLFSIRCVRN
jgi:uncharacterized protein (TIGR02145 family)